MDKSRGTVALMRYQHASRGCCVQHKGLHPRETLFTPPEARISRNGTKQVLNDTNNDNNEQTSSRESHDQPYEHYPQIGARLDKHALFVASRSKASHDSSHHFVA